MQAAKILGHLQDAASALNRTHEIVLKLDKADREKLTTPLKKFRSCN